MSVEEALGRMRLLLARRSVVARRLAAAADGLSALLETYDRGKYFSSTQHPTYFEIVPEAKSFTYLVSNGSEVWTERYYREETPSIIPTISDFLEWLDALELAPLYKEKWLAL